MENNYNSLINSFKGLTEVDKRKIIIQNIGELLVLLYKTNKTYDAENTLLPVINDYSDENEYLDALFTQIISLKEETAKLVSVR